MARIKHLNPFSEELIAERLRFENPWWSDGKTESEYDEKPRRLYFNLFRPIVEEVSINRAVVLMGPRRVGKTVMMHHTIQHLLNQNVNPKKICFINIENPIYNNIHLDQLFSYVRKATSESDPKGWFVFFDEVIF